MRPRHIGRCHHRGCLFRRTALSHREAEGCRLDPEPLWSSPPPQGCLGSLHCQKGQQWPRHGHRWLGKGCPEGRRVVRHRRLPCRRRPHGGTLRAGRREQGLILMGGSPGFPGSSHTHIPKVWSAKDIFQTTEHNALTSREAGSTFYLIPTPTRPGGCGGLVCCGCHLCRPDLQQQ